MDYFIFDIIYFNLNDNLINSESATNELNK